MDQEHAMESYRCSLTLPIRHKRTRDLIVDRGQSILGWLSDLGAVSDLENQKGETLQSETFGKE